MLLPVIAFCLFFNFCLGRQINDDGTGFTRATGQGSQASHLLRRLTARSANPPQFDYLNNQAGYNPIGFDNNGGQVITSFKRFYNNFTKIGDREIHTQCVDEGNGFRCTQVPPGTPLDGGFPQSTELNAPPPGFVSNDGQILTSYKRYYNNFTKIGDREIHNQCVDEGHGFVCTEVPPGSFPGGFPESNPTSLPTNQVGGSPPGIVNNGGPLITSFKRYYNNFTKIGDREIHTQCVDEGQGFRCAPVPPGSKPNVFPQANDPFDPSSFEGLGGQGLTSFKRVYNNFTKIGDQEIHTQCIDEGNGFQCNQVHPAFPSPGGYIAPTTPPAVNPPPPPPHTPETITESNNESGYCASSPCPPDTLCIDVGNKYRCAAVTPGSPIANEVLKGKPHRVIFDMFGLKKCRSDTCQHGGTCRDDPSAGFRCFCPRGIKGKMCEININECKNNPCLHGRCYDLVNNFECDCDPGYFGKRCEIEIDECESNPCARGAYCTDLVNGYECAEPSVTDTCGKAVLETGVPKVRGGEVAPRGAFPWHAGIYEEVDKKFECNCGGSLVSTNAILTAAHCLTYEVEGNSRNIAIKDISQFRVALGKRYRYFNTRMDPYAQVFNVEKFFIHPDYTGPQSNYGDDIAIIYLSTVVKFTVAVQPVCLDLRNNNDNPIADHALGMIPGWGRTENEAPSDVLMVAEMPYAPRKDCYKNTELITYLTKDKICAGDPKVSKTTVCDGDSGGGYVLSDASTRQFFLRGIVSLGAQGCQTEDYALFTDISKHAGLIYKKLYEDITS